MHKKGKLSKAESFYLLAFYRLYNHELERQNIKNAKNPALKLLPKKELQATLKQQRIALSQRMIVHIINEYKLDLFHQYKLPQREIGKKSAKLRDYLQTELNTTFYNALQWKSTPSEFQPEQSSRGS